MNIMRFIIPKSMVEYVTVDSTVRQGIEKMRYHRYVAIPVLDRDGKYVGTLRNDDILNYLLDKGSFDQRDSERDGVVQIMSDRSVKPVYHTSSVEEVIEQVKEHNFVPVVDDRGCFIGIILRRDILNYILKFYDDKTGGNNDGR
ncbi:MAG: CBS domain-containing protein [Clostridia bacterium]|nr:CBS domain-containing protein [Clostridia bacterium]